jgi:hypothetical protein
MLLLLSQMTAFAAGTCAPGVAALTPADAWPTVQAAIDASVGAEPVVVCPGRWTESLTANPDGYLTLVGATGRAQDVTLITDVDYGIYLAGGRDASLEDMTLTTDPLMASPASALIFSWDCDALTLQDIRIVGATAASLVDAYSNTDVTAVRVEDNSTANGISSAYADLGVRGSEFARNRAAPGSSAGLVGTQTGSLDLSHTTFRTNLGFENLVSTGNGGRLHRLEFLGNRLSGDLIFVVPRTTPGQIVDVGASHNVVGDSLLHLIAWDSGSVVVNGVRFQDNASRSSIVVVDGQDSATFTFQGLDLLRNTARSGLIEADLHTTDVTGDHPVVTLSGGRWVRNTTGGAAVLAPDQSWDADLGRNVRPIRFELDGVDVGGVADNRFGRRVPGCRGPLPLGVVSWVWDDRTREYCTPP